MTKSSKRQTARQCAGKFLSPRIEAPFPSPRQCVVTYLWSEVEDGAETVGAAAVGRAEEVALFIHDQTCGRVSSVTAAGEGMKHPEFAGGSQHEDGSAAVVIAADSCALKGCAVEIALGIADHTAVGSKAVRRAGEAVEHVLDAVFG